MYPNRGLECSGQITFGNANQRGVSCMNHTSFGEILGDFADSVANNFRQPVQAHPEDQLKGPVGELLRAAGELTNLTVSWRTEVHPEDIYGRPDIGVVVNGLLTGLVELKRPGLGARAERFTGRNRGQWERFKALPNLIYTDGSEWSLYRSGQLEKRVRIADDVSTGGAGGVGQSAQGSLGELLRDFLYWEPIVPANAEGVAKFLAPLARVLRDDVLDALIRDSNALKTAADEWRGLLFPEGDWDQFADAYAQTVTYALLLARFEGAESLTPLRAADVLQREHALLAEALQLLEAPPVREELIMPIELLERAIGAVDPGRISRDGDPWLYFYEHFLGAYDPELRRNRGVYFTPVEVVRTQVRLAGELLRTRFNKPMAFADDGVVVLDPAVGTGTYPLAILDHASEAVEQRLGPGAVPGKIRDLAERMNAFEILVGPYSVAHLRLSQRLRDAGVTDRAPRVYLTDTLETPNQMPEFTSSLLQAHLTEEGRRALEVKRDVRVFVCLGNPPYDREEHDPDDDVGQRKGGWVRYGDEGEDVPLPILEDFLAPAREAGQSVHLKNLYNDYVYFWRWALWKALDSTEDAGIVTFITASSYLRGPGFSGMRQKMREVFDELWLIDLEGDSIGARKTENVFAIRIPVAIAIGVRYGSPKPHTPARVWKTRLTGSESEKLASLDGGESFSRYSWTECTDVWDEPFYPQGTGKYFDWPALIDVFPWQHSGVQFKRTWPIGETEEVLKKRWRTFLSQSSSDRAILFRETRDRTVWGQYRKLIGAGSDRSLAALDAEEPLPDISEYAYRSFDRHFALCDARLGDRSRPALHRAHGDKQAYLTGLLTNVPGVGPAATATADIPDLDHFRGSFGAKHVIPLWRDAKATQPNVTGGLLETIGSVYGGPVSAEALFSYAYGIMSQPEYVEQFWDQLELPPPRLPITKNPDLFQRIAEHGARLLYLHTYGKRFGRSGDDGAVPQGAARCTRAVSLDQYPENHLYNPKTRVLRVGDGEFYPVDPRVWKYSVSGLEVVKSWLDRRKRRRSGRRSSPLDEIRPEHWEFTEQLLELLWILEATIALQPEGEALLEELLESELFTNNELPSPTAEEREPPRSALPPGSQLALS